MGINNIILISVREKKMYEISLKTRLMRFVKAQKILEL